MIVLKQEIILNALKRLESQVKIPFIKQVLNKKVRDLILEFDFDKKVTDLIELLDWINNYVVKDFPILGYFHNSKEDIIIKFEVSTFGEGKFLALDENLDMREVPLEKIFSKSVLDLWLYIAMTQRSINRYNNKSVDYLIYHIEELKDNVIKEKEEIIKLKNFTTKSKRINIDEIEGKLLNFNDMLTKLFILGEYEKIINQYGSKNDNLRCMRIVIESLINIRNFTKAQELLTNSLVKFTEPYEKGILNYLEGKLLYAKNEPIEALKKVQLSNENFDAKHQYWINKTKTLNCRINIQLGFYTDSMDSLLSILPFFESNSDVLECNTIYGGLSLLYDNLPTIDFMTRLFEKYLSNNMSLEEKITKITSLEENLPQTSKSLYDPPVFYYESNISESQAMSEL